MALSNTLSQVSSHHHGDHKNEPDGNGKAGITRQMDLLEKALVSNNPRLSQSNKEGEQEDYQ